MYLNVGKLPNFSIAMGIACQNKMARCSHVWIRTSGSSKLITTSASCQINANNSNSWPNNKKYGEKDERKACWLNLYPIVNHGSCKSQSQIWPLWRPYFRKPRFTIFTIHLASPFTSGWFHEIMRWSINAFSHNFWNSPRNFVLWLVKILAGAPNLVNTLCKNAYVTLSLLWFGNGTNPNHLENAFL
jgi:hypothetical protein